MTNWSGITASLSALVRPSILEPRLVVSSISNLDFNKFKQRGVVGVVIDKDNCLTVPHRDQLAQSLHQSWQDLLDTFDPENVLIVSNSVGTHSKDPALLGAEAVSRNLRVPVLSHAQPKPGRKCVSQIALHFDQLSSPSPSTSQIVYSPLAQSRRSRLTPVSPNRTSSDDALKILVIGDRLATDLILSTRLSKLSLPLPTTPTSLFSRRTIFSPSGSSTDQVPKRRRIETVGILTTGLHAKEGFGTMFLRGLEKIALRRLEKKRRRLRVGWEGEKWEECLKGYEAAEAVIESAPRITELPETASTPGTAVATDSSTSLSEPQSQRRTISTKLMSSLSTLLALPSTLPHFFRRLPSSLLNSLKALPSKTYTSISRSLRKTLDYSLEKLPFIASKLHKPMDRLVKIYQAKPEQVGMRSTRETTRRLGMGEGEGVVDRVLDRVEGVVREARERVVKRG